MEVILENVGKKFLRKWVFRRLDSVISSGERIGITGHNGSGKSTLLRIISGAMPPSEGRVRYANDSEEISLDRVYRQFAFAAPYTDLIEEMTLGEALRFHTRFRRLRQGIGLNDFMDVIGNQFKEASYIKSYSSGMKQRVRLALAIMTEASVVILDEPTSNLDDDGRTWYQDLIDRVPPDVTLVVASNDREDMRQCERYIHIPDYS